RGRPAVPERAQAYDVDSLRLVQPGELEQAGALGSMVGRVTTRNQLPLAHLALRLGSLLGRPVDPASHPLAPAAPVALFSASCAPLNPAIKVRLILLTTFERYVFNSIDSLYLDAHGLLKNAGPLPDLKQAS